MENQAFNKEQGEQMWKNWEEENRRGKIAGGLLVVTIGSLFLARELGVELPNWLFSWKTLLIGLGLVVGIKHRFRRPGWLIAVAIGSIFLLADIYPGLIVKSVLIPVIIILAGLFMIFKPRRRYHHRHWRRWQKYKNYNWQADYYCKDRSGDKEDYVEANCVFGSLKRNVISKDFKGGEVTAVFGGAEINLNQADISDKARLEINAVFGGVTLIVPANWEIKSELNSVLGSIEDKRPIQATTTGSGKILILEGNTVCGGIDIKSY